MDDFFDVASFLAYDFTEDLNRAITPKNAQISPQAEEELKSYDDYEKILEKANYKGEKYLGN